MAYFDAALLDAPAAPAEAPEPFSGSGGGFTPIEWRVIEMAARDGLASLARPGRLRRLTNRLFGAGAASPLADPRLELLRRAAVRYWRTGAAVEQAQVETLITAGFSLPQVALLSRYIGARRTRG